MWNRHLPHNERSTLFPFLTVNLCTMFKNRQPFKTKKNHLYLQSMGALNPTIPSKILRIQSNSYFFVA